MAWLDQLFTPSSARAIDGADPRSDQAALLWGSAPSASGVHVDEHTAFNYSVVWACVRTIAEPLATMPWHTFERNRQTGRRRRVDGQVQQLLHVRADEEIDAITFRETVMSHVLTRGNGYAEIETPRRSGSDAKALHLIEPNRVNPDRTRDGALYYDVSQPREGNVAIPAERMFHVHGLGFNGLTGFSPIQLARESVGTGLALEQYAGRFFSNDATPGTVISRPQQSGPLSDTARKNLREEWVEMFGGVANSHKPAILQEGMTANTLSVAPNDAQFIESRQFQARDVAARWFKVPLSLVGLSESGVKNMEEESIRFARYVLPIWAKKLEVEADRKLVGQSNRFTKLDFNELLRGDTKTRGSFYRLLMDRGVFSVNEVRDREDMEPVEGGDLRMVPKNMVTLEQAGTAAQDNTPRPGRNDTDGGEEGGDDNEPDPGRDRSGGDEQMHAGQIAERFMPAIADLCERLVRKECNAAQRAAAKHAEDPDRFAEWLAKFYADHEPAIVDGLRRGCETLASLTGAGSIEQPLAAWAKREADEARRALHEAYLDGGVDQLIADWQSRRPEAMAHDLTCRLIQPTADEPIADEPAAEPAAAE